MQVSLMIDFQEAEGDHWYELGGVGAERREEKQAQHGNTESTTFLWDYWNGQDLGFFNLVDSSSCVTLSREVNQPECVKRHERPPCLSLLCTISIRVVRLPALSTWTQPEGFAWTQTQRKWPKDTKERSQPHAVVLKHWLMGAGPLSAVCALNQWSPAFLAPRTRAPMSI